MGKNISYHTRLYGNDSVKICGGSFGGSIDLDTVQRLVNNHFSVIVKNSGHAVFVDKEAREVNLYLHVSPNETEQAKIAFKEWRLKREKELELEKAKERQIESLLSGLSNDEIIRRLS
jgi:hypothetical protein